MRLPTTRITSTAREQNKSDCQVIKTCVSNTTQLCVELDGMFAFVIEDRENDVIVAARDHMGDLCNMANGKDGSVWFSSEMKTPACIWWPTT